MSGRLSGKSRSSINRLEEVSKLHIHRIPTMTEALRLASRCIWKRETMEDRERVQSLGTRPIDGNKVRLATAMELSDKLIDDAIAEDPRLAKKAQWKRRDEGEYVDSGLLAQGDDAPFYKHSKAIVNDSTACGEPFRIIVSTDDNKVPEGAAAAFIASIRLLQQFMPVEVWWQGSWLNESRTRGFVFHVPLIQGDMDFSRLEFCIADDKRDSFSFLVSITHAVIDVKESNKGCGYRAQKSYLPEAQGYTNFIAHDGIAPNMVASQVARWLGWDVGYQLQVNQRETDAAALQSLPVVGDSTPYQDTRTKEQIRQARAESDSWYREHKQSEKQKAGQRLTG